MSKKRIHNTWLLGVLGSSFAAAACSFATSFDDLSSSSSSDSGPSAFTEDAADGATNESLNESGPNHSDAAPPVREFIPDEGLYAYQAFGTESLDFTWAGNPRASGPRAQGDAFSASVVHSKDAPKWTFTARTNVNHIDTFVFEAHDQTLFETYGLQRTEWVLPTIGNVSPNNQWNCITAPALLLQRNVDNFSTRTHSCDGQLIAYGGTNVDFGTYSITATYEFVGEEMIQVEATTVPTYHFKQAKRAIGANVDIDPVNSTLIYDWYFRKTDGLPVKQSRTTRLQQMIPTFFGPAISKISEDGGGWQLASLTTKPLPIVDAGVDAATDSGVNDAAKGQ